MKRDMLNYQRILLKHNPFPTQTKDPSTGSQGNFDDNYRTGKYLYSTVSAKLEAPTNYFNRYLLNTP